MIDLLPLAWTYFWREETPYVVSAALILAAALLYLRPGDRRSIGYTLGLFALCLAGQFTAGLLDARGLSTGASAAHEFFVIGSGMALIRLAGLCLFRLLLPAAGLRPPRIIEDIGLCPGLSATYWPAQRLPERFAASPCGFRDQVRYPGRATSRQTS